MKKLSWETPFSGSLLSKGSLQSQPNRFFLLLQPLVPAMMPSMWKLVQRWPSATKYTPSITGTPTPAASPAAR